MMLLKNFVNCIMFTPWAANAGPIGGAGVAFPPLICSLTTAFNFFAMFSPLWCYRIRFVPYPPTDKSKVFFGPKLAV